MTTQPLTTRSLLLALLITFIWGVNFVVIKWSVGETSPLLVAALRFAVAAFPAVFFIPKPAVPARILWGYGLAVGVMQFGLLYLAIQLGMSAGMGSLLMQIQGFFTALLAARLFGEKIMPWQAWGMGVAFTGMAIIGAFAGHDVPFIPLLITLVAALGWSISNLLVRAAGNVNVFSLVIWSALIPPIPLTIMAGLTRGWGSVAHTLTHSGWPFWAAIVFMGLFNTVLGFGIWSSLIQKHGAARVAPLSLLVPVFGMLSSAIIFHETFPAGKVVGALLVSVGIVLHVFGGKWWRKGQGPGGKPHGP